MANYTDGSREVRTLDKLAKVIMTVGGIVSAAAMCCLDSEGVYMYYAGAVCIMGGFVIGAGYGLKVLSERRRETSIELFYFRQTDKPDSNLGLIEDKKIAP